MKIGVPKEIKTKEYRVGIIPSGVELLVQSGHDVYVEENAGEKSGFSNDDYKAAGAIISKTAKEIFDTCEMIVKVKEPQVQEYDLLKPGQILFTYLHLAPNKELTKILQEKQVAARVPREVSLGYKFAVTAAHLSTPHSVKFAFLEYDSFT